MAWNEPGGGDNKPKDPWGGGSNGGPPDLDEALKKLQQKFAGMFGGAPAMTKAMELAKAVFDKDVAKKEKDT